MQVVSMPCRYPLILGAGGEDVGLLKLWFRGSWMGGLGVDSRV